METLADHGHINSCVLAAGLPQILAVSVVDSTGTATGTSGSGSGTLSGDRGTDPAGMTYVTTERHPSYSGVASATLASESVQEEVHEGDVLQPEDLGHQSTVSLLAADSDEAVSVTNQVIHQYQIDHGLEERGPENGEDAPEVIFVYQDIFTCGACSKQFVDLSDFLEHKTHHTIGSVFHKCDLCQMVSRSRGLIADHYQKFHQVTFSEEDERQDQTQNVTDSEEHTINGTISTNIENLAVSEKNGQIENVMIPGGLSIGIDQICAGEGDEAQGPDSEHQGTAEQQVLFVQNGLTTVQDDFRAGSVTIEGLSASESSPGGISLLKTSTREGNLIGTSLTNGLQTILQDNSVGTDELSSHNGHVSLLEPKKEGSEQRVVPETVPEPKPDFNFILQTEMVKGSTFMYGKTWFKCLHCAFKTNTKLTISKHMQDEHVNLIDLQQNLDVKDVTGNDKRKVMKMSTYENIFGRDSRFRRRAKKAKRTEKPDVPAVYKCGTCGKVFTRTRYLRKHQSTHRTENKYLCDECGKAFKSRTYLRVHRRIHKEKLFNCNQCNFSSKINAAIHAHRQVHSQGSVLCDICGYAYTDKSTLSKHKRVHDENRPYKCNFSGCTWRFKTEVMCKAHIRAHTTEGKFKCSFCGYLFRHKHHLQRHETSMHGVQHTKTRTNQTTKGPTFSARKPPASTTTLEGELAETVNLVINADGDTPVHLQSDVTQHLVVATDNKGTPIAFEGTDISALNVAYQTLFQNQEGSARTLIMAQPDTQIIFKQGY